MTEVSARQEQRRKLLVVAEKLRVYAAAAEGYGKAKDLKYWLGRMQEEIERLNKILEG